MTAVPAPFVAAVRALLAAGWKDNQHRIAWANKSSYRTRILRNDVQRVHWYRVDQVDAFRLVYQHEGRLDFEHEPASLAEALDLLVALGVLEPRHSSAWAAGYAYAVADAALVWRGVAEAALVAS